MDALKDRQDRELRGDVTDEIILGWRNVRQSSIENVHTRVRQQLWSLTNFEFSQLTVVIATGELPVALAVAAQPVFATGPVVSTSRKV